MNGWRRGMVLVAVALVIAGSAFAAAVDTAKIVILRGTPGKGTTALSFVTDETGLDTVQLGGVSGKELLALKGQRLMEQADVYRQAQKAAGVKDPAPLYVVLDPTGTWAYATPWGSFSYTRNGTDYTVTSPYLRLGEQMDHQGQAVYTTDESTADNQAMVDRTKAWFEAQLKAKGVRRIPDFQKDVLDRWQITVSGGKPAGLSQVTGDLTSDRYLK